MKLGLLLYGSLDTLSGGYLYDRRLVDSLRRQGDEVEVISLPEGSYASQLRDNLRFRLPEGLDLLIEDELSHPSLLSANGQPHRYPVVSLVHHLRSAEGRPAWQNDLYAAVERRYLRSVDGFIFSSQATRDDAWRLAGRERPHLVAYPPADRFSPSLTDVEIGERAKFEKLRIIFLGNVIPRKGLHTLLRALCLVSCPVRLDVIGSLEADRRYARQMQQKAARLCEGTASTVAFHGRLDDAALIEKMALAHVLCVPSSHEGFGIVYLEGMAFGLPAIGTTSGGAGEIITDGMDGFLVEPGQARSLSYRLCLLAEDRSLLLDMSLAARQRFRRQPPWDETAVSIHRFLQGML